MKTSVIIATYRRTESFKKALLSLATQTYKNIEVVVVDDNADENFNKEISKIVNEVKSENAHMDINLITNVQNSGSAKTRNIGIASATGEYITFLDDDDIYLPEKIEKQLEYMVENELDYSVTDLDLYSFEEKLINRRKREYIERTDRDSLLKYHFMYHITGTDTMMFKKEYLDRIGGFDAIDVGDEFYLMKKAIESGGKFGYLRRCDVKAYIHTEDEGLSSGEGKLKGENQLFNFKKGYFHLLDKKSVAYIKMRHHAVLAFAFLRMKKIFLFFAESAKSFFCSPIECIKLFFEYKG